MKSIFLLLLSVIIVFTACVKEEPLLIDSIEHTIIDSSFNAKTSLPIELDINNDNLPDFRFYTETINSDRDMIEAFLIECLNDNKVVSINNTYNYSFHCRELLPAAENELISEKTDRDHSWDSNIGVMAIRMMSDDEYFSGRWADEQAHTLPIQMSVSGKIFYGWIKLRFDRAAMQMRIIDYAWNKAESRPIVAGKLVSMK